MYSREVSSVIAVDKGLLCIATLIQSATAVATRKPMGHQPVCPGSDQNSDSVRISNTVRKVHVVVWLSPSSQQVKW